MSLIEDSLIPPNDANSDGGFVYSSALSVNTENGPDRIDNIHADKPTSFA